MKSRKNKIVIDMAANHFYPKILEKFSGIALILATGCFFLFSCNDGKRTKVLTPEIKNYLGKPSLLINGRAVVPIIYANTTCPGGRFTRDEMPQHCIREFADQGIRLFQAELFLQDIFPYDNDSLNLDLVKKQIRGVLDICPGAGFFIRLRCNSSPEWNRGHPEECVKYADTTVSNNEEFGLHRWDDHDTENSLRYSLASKKWQQDVVKKITNLCRALAGTEEGNSLLGIQIATGIYGEGHYWGFIGHEPDVSLPMTRRFREWIREKYKTDAELQKAWNNAAVTFETATVPGLKERYPVHADGIFRDPKTERQMIDYNECQHQVVADNIILFGKTAKENWPRYLITGCFYGYFFNVFGRLAAGGHLQMERVLNSPFIDYLCGPMSYLGIAREIGGSGQSRGIIDECRLHDKIWLDEWDENTYLDKYCTEYHNRTTTLQEDISKMRRNLTQTYCRGGGRWFYDFGPRTIGGWWDDSTLLREIKTLNIIFDKYQAQPYRHDADVLFVYDVDVYYYLAHNWTIDIISHTAVEWASADAYHCGAIFDECLLFDLPKMDLKKYKAIVFANTFKLTDEQRDFIKKNVMKEDRTIVWNYMPGYCNGIELNEKFVKELAGMNIQRIQLSQKPPTIVNDHDTTEFYTVWNQHPPVYVINDKEASPIAHFKEKNLTAIATKKENGWTSVFCSLPLQKAGLMRQIFRDAGCHIFSDSGDVIYSGGGIFCVHTKNGGKRAFNLLNGRKIEIELAPKSTVLFDNETGEVLLK